ncbi:hypothetical protein OSTOST_08410 [Ostertagia ostertagi]
MSMLFTGMNSTQHITNAISVLFALYPTINPIIIVIFVKEYRNFILGKLKPKISPSHTASFSFVGQQWTTDISRSIHVHLSTPPGSFTVIIFYILVEVSTMSNDLLTATVFVISTISLITNLILLVVYVRCPLRKISLYKHFFLLIVIEDVIYSVTFTLDMPRVFFTRQRYDIYRYWYYTPASVLIYFAFHLLHDIFCRSSLDYK